MSELPTGTVTFVFTDIEGSTMMLQRLGDAFAEVLEDHNRVIRAAFSAGSEVRSEGDSFFYAFSSAPAALDGAVAVQRELAAYPWPEGGTVRVRMGMHTGEGVLGGDDYVGLDVHRASRVAAAGHGGQILLSAATSVLVASALSDEVTLWDLGDHRFKDLEQPERVHQVVIRGLAADFPPIRSLDAAPNNLPAQPTAFIGRAAEVGAVGGLLERGRLVTLTGPGGTGKTRLAVHVAEESLGDYPDGVFYVPLESLRSADLVVPAISTQLGVIDNGTQPPLDALASRVGADAALLVLDNFEHVIEASANIGSLLSQATNLKLLITSQTPLRVRGEQIYPVPPLAAAEGVELFAELVASADASFRLTQENRGAVEEVVALLEGMPLAIELTAPRVVLFGIAGLRDRLVERLDVPGVGFADLPERHRSLHDAIAWSYDLLNDDEQALLRRLSVFEGGFTLDAAEAVASVQPAAGVIEGVASLLDRSLLRRQVHHGEARFSMLESIRQFALDALSDDGEYDDVAHRHGEYFAQLAETARPILDGEGQQVWLDRLTAEHDNLRAVLRLSRDSGKPDLGLRTAGSVWRFFHRRGHMPEARQWLEELLDLPGASPRARAEGLDGLASIAYWQADYATADRLYAELLELYRELGDDVRVADTLFAVSTTAAWLGDLERGLEFAEEARVAYEEAGAPQGAARVAAAVAWSTWQTGRLEEALVLWAEARAGFAAIGDDGEVRQTDVGRAAVLSQLGRSHDAVALGGEVLEAMVNADDISGMIMTADFLAAITAATNPEPAVRLAGASERLRAELGGGLTAESVGQEPVRSVVAGAMDAAAIDAAWSAGEKMSLEEAVELGREVVANALRTRAEGTP